MTPYIPDNWVLIKIERKGEPPWYKILGGFDEGDDDWRVNSGISKVTDNGAYYKVEGVSGSIYCCYKNREKFSPETEIPYRWMVVGAPAIETEITTLKMTDWMVGENDDG